ncbi:MAG: LL-diaminopimelate aminotransferase [Oscillospiraceae bacterium]|jgi:LL-diaminopimelate aminotransferase|nr:LL-diaminopimelate aminotransferase [Oscillospiraceae bacterium]
MARMNGNFLNLKENYLFIEISRRVGEFARQNPGSRLIRMGIGDVTLPLAPAVVEAGKKAFDEMGVKSTFRGYEDSGRGYDFLREAVSGYYKGFGADIPPDEIYISDGAKSDSGNIGDIFSADCAVTVTDPAYPVYVDSNVMGGRDITYASSDESNGFAAAPDLSVKTDVIYLCSPNNPTGSAYTFDQLKKWVDYAVMNKAVIVYDAAYEAFVTEKDKPRSIMLIEGARKCAVEICSLSKTAGFTGTRCGYAVIPKELVLSAPNGEEKPFYKLWERRQGSKFNGVSYPVQRAAEAVFSPAGLRQTREAVDYYLGNAGIMAKTLSELGVPFTGGTNSPYVWFKCPNNTDSWEFFDEALHKINVVGTPGAGFGKNGANWFRLTAFNTRENTLEAMKRLKELF